MGKRRGNNTCYCVDLLSVNHHRGPEVEVECKPDWINTAVQVSQKLKGKGEDSPAFHPIGCALPTEVAQRSDVCMGDRSHHRKRGDRPRIVLEGDVSKWARAARDVSSRLEVSHGPYLTSVPYQRLLILLSCVSLPGLGIGWWKRQFQWQNNWVILVTVFWDTWQWAEV